MIDTIVLDVRNDEKYKHFFQKLVNSKKSSWTEFHTTPPTVDIESGVLESASLVAAKIGADDVHNYMRSYRLYNDSDMFIPVLHVADIKAPSWDYRINMHLNTERLRLTFSLPKYLYGTNVFQFCSFNHSIEELHKSLMNFLDIFFRRHIGNIDFNDVEVRQIDLCYNQYFNTEQDALTYLEAQKKLVDKKSRANAKGYTIYKTSFQYLTQYYNFKVYHKGSEFALHDYKRLSDVGKGRLADDIKVYADKILRYEMSFKHSSFNMLFREYFFRGNQKHYSSALGFYVEKIMRMAHYLSPKKLDEYKRQSKRFLLASEFDTTTDFLQLAALNSFPFNVPFLRLMQHYFDEKMLQYEIRTVPSVDQFLLRLKQFNNKNEVLSNLSMKKRRTNKRTNLRLLLAFHFLAAGNKFNDLKGLVSGSTLKDLQADLKELGIDSSSEILNIPLPDKGFASYEIMCREFGVLPYFLK